MSANNAKTYICKCLICEKPAINDSEKDGIHPECFPTKVSQARCYCGTIHNVPSNDLVRIHKGIIILKDIDPKKIYYFKINVCSSCDPEQKSTDFGAVAISKE